MNLVDEAQKNRHVLFMEAQLVLQIADQRRTSEIGFGIALGRRLVRLGHAGLDQPLGYEHTQPRHRETGHARDDVLLGQHHACSFIVRRGS
ncbi:hypothetical protein AUC68_08965 [Methyloceanibacter methanicus]|uniref:Uncharacterized protein n=1 Tax=Methyloceanibacter methanicus TaxID=1774968 RepID=A0A1E3VYA6_9HYPH|nr:hypothetical protein AUC68_08965 [Methyloceanibacter methanicus]